MNSRTSDRKDSTPRDCCAAGFQFALCRLWVIRDRVEPGSKSGYVRYAAESGSKFRALMASPPGIAA